MPTEMTTKSDYSAVSAQRASSLTHIKSVQKPTVRYDDVSFDDILEAINPLNHIPLISGYFTSTAKSINTAGYESAADESAQNNQNTYKDNPIMPLASMVAGGLIGGVIGLVSAAVNVIFEQATGSKISQKISTTLFDFSASKADAQQISTGGTSTVDMRKLSASMPGDGKDGYVQYIKNNAAINKMQMGNDDPDTNGLSSGISLLA